MNEPDMQKLLARLLRLKHETEWVEFKKNNDNPEKIGEYLSAIANSAALHKQTAGFIIWGIEDDTHQVVGTIFKPREAKVGGEELEHWLSRLLSPSINFCIHELTYEEKRVVIFEVPATTHTPVSFKNTRFIRVGSYKKKLDDHPEKQRQLWAISSQTAFETEIAMHNVSSDTIFNLLDYPSYFEITGQPLPDNRPGILDRLANDDLIIHHEGDSYDITNLGGVLFAKRLDAFDKLTRKAVRVVIYQGNNRIETQKELVGQKGYAVGFEGLVEYINDQLPHNEHIEQALRREEKMYPELAIRELVANALIHQDFTVTGAGPMVEIFADRIEITNPGRPLIDKLRLLDSPPKSRNDILASLMRRMGICEERGSGIDKVFKNVEIFQLPAPDFVVYEEPDSMKVVLSAYKTLRQMTKDEKIRACYQHAGLMWVSSQQMTNTSLRKRMGINSKNYSTASRIISDAVDAGLVRPFDPDNTSKKHQRYVPFWA
ncbi:MAG: putative DNA binding domain-containing protein [Magnetococcales bacterium]|nr:putative DNA binding domain-containing protein [Magnetococcales bacterium]